MQGFDLFKRHVKEIHSAAAILISRQQLTKPDWPELSMTNAGADGFKVEFVKPTIIWNAPLRASSSASVRRAIIMDGCFYFKNGVFDKGGACLEVYSIEKKANGFRLGILEAMHFDIEPDARSQSPFHPMFHVQFGKNNRWDLEALRAQIATLSRSNKEHVEIDREKEMPTRDVRIPTPQMDYLSMLVMVVADYFCEKKCNHEVKNGFSNLIHKVMNSKNVARVGSQSRELEGRWVDPNKDRPFSAGHWYQESCK